MAPTRQICGIFDLDDIEVGCALDVLGAAPASPKGGGKPKPGAKPAHGGGGAKVRYDSGKGKKSPHKRALARAGKVVDKAATAAKRAAATASKYKPTKVVPLAPVALTKVKGEDVFGYRTGWDDPLSAFLNIASGGANILVDNAARGTFNDDHAGPGAGTGGTASWDWASSPAYRAAQRRLATAEGQRQAAASRQPHAVIPVTIPSFSLSAAGDDVVGSTSESVVLFGASRPLTAKQQAAVRKHANAAAKTGAAQKRTQVAAKKAAAAAVKLKATQKKAAPYVARLSAKKSLATRVHGDDATSIGLDEVLGYCGEAGIDPVEALAHLAAEGVEVTGFFYDVLGAEEADPTGGEGDGGGGGGDDTGEIPMPVRDQPLPPSDAQIVFRKVPDDGVKYQGDKGLPQDSLGSWGIFYGTDPAGQSGYTGDGFVWGGTYWSYRSSQDFANSEHKYDFHPAPAKFVTIKDVAENSLGRNWGPLIGNPRGPLAGLQYAMDTGEWFWQSDKAPAWATAEADAALALLNKQTADAAKAAKDADDARVAQEQAAMEEDKARQDAANELAQSAADTQAAIVEQAQAAQRGSLEVQQQAEEQRAAAAEAKISEDAAAAQARLDVQLATQALQAEQQQVDYAREHPEEFYSPAAQAAQASDPEAQDDGSFDGTFDGRTTDGVDEPLDYNDDPSADLLDSIAPTQEDADTSEAMALDR